MCDQGFASPLHIQCEKVRSDDRLEVHPTDAVLIDYVARVAPTKEVVDGPIFQVVKDWLIVVGDKDVMPAVEMGVRYMHEGETAVIWSHSKYALGPLTRSHDGYDMPPDSHVRVEITVKSIETSDEDPHYAMRICHSKKEIGNDVFLNEWSKGAGKHRALYLYQKAAKGLELYLQNPEARKEEAARLLVDCLNNVAAVYIKAKEYHTAKEACVKVLELEPSNYKALIRAAKAALLDTASSFEEVEAAIHAASQVADGSASDVKRLKTDFLRRKKEYDEKTKSMFSVPSSMSKGKEQTPMSPGENENTSTARNDSSNASLAEKTASHNSHTWALHNWRKWPWRERIIPYGFQLILPFLTYSVFILSQKKSSFTYHTVQAQAELDEL